MTKRLDGRILLNLFYYKGIWSKKLVHGSIGMLLLWALEKRRHMAKASSARKGAAGYLGEAVFCTGVFLQAE